VLARVDSDKRRKVWNAANCDADGADGLWWARYDSNPLLKAKEPSGRAESARSRRAWSAARVNSCRGSDVAITDLRHLRAMRVPLRCYPDSIGLSHRADVLRGLRSRLGGLVDLKTAVSSCESERSCG
jgi:hypothetical protein